MQVPYLIMIQSISCFVFKCSNMQILSPWQKNCFCFCIYWFFVLFLKALYLGIRNTKHKINFVNFEFHKEVEIFFVGCPMSYLAKTKKRDTNLRDKIARSIDNDYRFDVNNNPSTSGDRHRINNSKHRLLR